MPISCFSPFISYLSHLSSYLSLFICYLTTSYLVYHCSYLDERPFFNFISWRTCPKKLHILFITLQLLMNTLLKTSYVDEQCPINLICYFSPFISCLSHLSFYLSLFICYLTHLSSYLSLFICYLTPFIGYLTDFISCLSLFSC